MKTKRVKVAGESTMRQLLLMLLSMIVTFFILMANKSWILQQVGSSSAPKEDQPADKLAKAPAQVTTNEAKQTAPKGEEVKDELGFMKMPQTPKYQPSPKIPEGFKDPAESNAADEPQQTSFILGASLENEQVNSVKPTIYNIPPKTRDTAPATGSLISSSIQCSAEVHRSYAQVPVAKAADGSSLGTPESLMQWCTGKRAQHNVAVGRSWGSLTRNDRMEWDRRRCNELLTRGKLQTCDEQWGWAYFETWRKNFKPVLAPNSVHGSNVSCIVDYKTTSFCEMRNVKMDFRKMRETGQSRSFDSGFITLFGERLGGFSALPMYPGISIQNDPNYHIHRSGTCDVYETRPTFVLSNDDIFNLGHYINDVIGIWAMTVLAGRKSKESILLNIDGLREGGPAGGPAHRLMLPQSPDAHGPYSPSYYGTWFADVQMAKAHKKESVCYSELYIFPLPGVPWFWNDWGRINDCSMVAASPLYQSFNVFLRQHLINHYRHLLQSQANQRDAQGKQLVTTLPNPPTDHVHIVIEVRKINAAKRGARTNSGRVIRNLPGLVAALQTLPNVKVTAQDFALLSFPEQIALAHSASILVSMHGAGTTHIFHMAIGQKNCCGLIELFPDRTVDLYTAEGYGNLARMLGFHHYRLVAGSDSTTSTGTNVDIEGIKRLAEKMVRHVSDTPTCLHEVRETASAVVAL